MEVSVVLPCLNEEKTIGPCIRSVRAALDQAGVRGEIIVADNDSTDGSAEIAREEDARVVDVRYRGYGNALRAGLEAARGRYLVFLDADMSYDGADIPRFVEKLRDGADLVIGSRFRGGIDPGAMPRLHRIVGTPALTALANLLFGCAISDVNCGMRALTKEAFERLELHSEGMEFASEMMIKAAQAGLRIHEIPITLHTDQRGRDPHLRSFRDGWRHLQIMMHFCSLWLFLAPGAGLALGGLALVWWTIGGPFELLAQLAGLCAVFVGVQVLLLGVTAQGRVRGSKYRESDSPVYRLIRRWVRVDTGLVLGLVAALAGMGLLAWALSRGLRSAGGGGLVPTTPGPQVVRLALLGAVSFICGLQVFFTSVFIGLFGLRVADDEPPRREKPASRDE